MTVRREDLDAAEAAILASVEAEFSGLRAKLDDEEPPAEWPNYTGAKPFEVRFPNGFRMDPMRGGIAAFEPAFGRQPLLALTSPDGGLLVLDWRGRVQWRREERPRLRAKASGADNLPGTNHAGVFAIAGILDDVVLGYVNEAGQLVLRDAASGQLIRRQDFSGAPGPPQVAIAARLAAGPACVLQFDQSTVWAVDLTTGDVLWRSSEYLGFDHAPVFAADLDGDGVDEILGAISLSGAGASLHDRSIYLEGTALGSLDSVGFGDVDGDGVVEMVLAEQGGRNATICLRPTAGEVVWTNTERPAHPTGDCDREIDPDKITVGNFLADEPGLEVHARSACGREPWIIGSDGRTIKHYRVEEVFAGTSWNMGEKSSRPGSEGGIDVVSSIDWHGNDHGNRIIVCKERHTEGDVAVIGVHKDPVARGFVLNREAIIPFPVDLAGDRREEIVVVERHRLAIQFHAADPRPSSPRLWESQIYRRQRQNFNYYTTA